LLDEVGRGTSTYDGLSIAWALVEHFNTEKIRTLFATHYHELTRLDQTLSHVQNASMLIHEEEGQLQFLRKVVPGAAQRSYGIPVAKLAGLPHPIIERATAILNQLENPQALHEETDYRIL
jgi:DNA mismatch repair protein MutS